MRTRTRTHSFLLTLPEKDNKIYRRMVPKPRYKLWLMLIHSKICPMHGPYMKVRSTQQMWMAVITNGSFSFCAPPQLLIKCIHYTKICRSFTLKWKAGKNAGVALWLYQLSGHPSPKAVIVALWMVNVFTQPLGKVTGKTSHNSQEILQQIRDQHLKQVPSTGIPKGPSSFTGFERYSIRTFVFLMFLMSLVWRLHNWICVKIHNKSDFFCIKEFSGKIYEAKNEISSSSTESSSLLPSIRDH